MPDTDFVAGRDLKIAANQTFTIAIENRGVPARNTNHRRGRGIDIDLRVFSLACQNFLDPLTPIPMTQIGENSFFLPVHYGFPFVEVQPQRDT
jgi:hypothetical protein